MSSVLRFSSEGLRNISVLATDEKYISTMKWIVLQTDVLKKVKEMFLIVLQNLYIKVLLTLLNGYTDRQREL